MTRLEKLRCAMDKLGCDAVLVTSEINEKYISSFNFTDGLLVITKNRACMITDSRYSEAAKNEAPDFEIILPQNGQITAVGEILAAEGAKTVAFEDLEMSVSVYNSYREKLTDCEFIPMGKMIGDLREFKDEAEIACIKAAQKITDDAFEHIIKVMTPKMTETEVALELEYFMRRAGAEEKSFDTICVSGAASSMPHGVPQNRPLQSGFLTMDYGAIVGGYHSDMTRTVCLGKADDEMKRLYNTVLQAQCAAIERMKVGMLCSDIDAIARDIIYDAGYKGHFGHSLGHGVGLEIHESPRFAPMATTALLTPGHVVTVEPGIYIEGKYGCRIEDMIIAREDGIEDITASRKELIELF